MALDLDPDRVRQAAAAGQSVGVGDAARLPKPDGRCLGAGQRVVVTITTRHRR